MTYLTNNRSQMSKLWIGHSLVNYTFVELFPHSSAFTFNTWMVFHWLAQLCLSSQAHVFQHAGRGRHLVYTNLWKFHFQIGNAAISPNMPNICYAVDIKSRWSGFGTKCDQDYSDLNLCPRWASSEAHSPVIFVNHPWTTSDFNIASSCLWYQCPLDFGCPQDAQDSIEHSAM